MEDEIRGLTKKRQGTQTAERQEMGKEKVNIKMNKYEIYY